MLLSPKISFSAFVNKMKFTDALVFAVVMCICLTLTGLTDAVSTSPSPVSGVSAGVTLASGSPGNTTEGNTAADRMSCTLALVVGGIMILFNAF